jgi:hypothetical protein
MAKRSESRGFTGYWIPAEIALDHTLQWAEKVLYCEITQLHAAGRCRAGNKHFATHLGVSERQVRTYLSTLESEGYIRKIQQDSQRVIEPRGRKRTSARAEADFRQGAEADFHINEKEEIQSKKTTAANATVDSPDSPPPPTEPKPSGRKATDHFQERFIDQYGVKPDWQTKDAVNAKRLVERHGIEQVVSSIDHYFTSGDLWFTKNGIRSFSGFYSHYTEIIAAMNATKAKPPDPRARGTEIFNLEEATRYE